MKWIVFYIVLFLNISFANTWYWAGVEVIGHTSTTREEVLKLVPLEVGSKYEEDYQSWQKVCNKIKERLGFYHTECSAVRFNDFKAYFTVNIVEFGHEQRVRFRSEPSENIQLASPAVLDLLVKLESRMWELFNQGSGAEELSTEGYLDYADPQMSKYVNQLIELVPSYRVNILNVLANDKNVNKRAKAAKLLNWALSVEDSISKAHYLLDDPSLLVRNNLSRFMGHYFSLFESGALKREVIKSISFQLKRPSHADRNKALYCLLDVVKSDASMTPLVKKFAHEEIEYIARESILNNVKGFASQLIEIINKQE